MPPKVVLSPEEKKKLQQEKKIAKKNAIIEGKRQLKRDELTREIKIGEINKKKISKQWQKILKEIKIPELLTDVEIMQRHFEYILDLKDFKISLLLDELDEADDQYDFNFRNHCENLQNIYKIYLDRLNDVKKDYDNELVYLYGFLRKQLRELEENSEEADTYIKTMIYELSVQEKQLENAGRSMYMSNLKEMEAKDHRELHFRKKKSEDKFENVWKSYVNYLENYMVQIGYKEKNFKERFERDFEIAKINHRQSNEIFTNYNLLRLARENLTSFKEKTCTKIEELDQERNYYQYIFLTLRSTYLKDKKYDNKILTDLVVESNEQLKNLKSYEALAEKILRMYTITRKHETRREKILPFPKTLPKKSRLMEHNWGNLKNLRSFWKKCALADTARNYILDEMMHLKEENSLLKRTIKDCMRNNCDRRLLVTSPHHKKLLQSSVSTCSHIVYNL